LHSPLNALHLPSDAKQGLPVMYTLQGLQSLQSSGSASGGGGGGAAARVQELTRELAASKAESAQRHAALTQALQMLQACAVCVFRQWLFKC
jgi:hypothetical protein